LKQPTEATTNQLQESMCLANHHGVAMRATKSDYVRQAGSQAGRRTPAQIVELYFLWAVFWGTPPAHTTAGDCSDGIICNHVECSGNGSSSSSSSNSSSSFPKNGVVRLWITPLPLGCVSGCWVWQVVVDCLMLSKVLAVITLMCHFYSPATPYASICVCVCVCFSALFIFYSASAYCRGFPTVAIAFTIIRTLSLALFFYLSVPLWCFLWRLQTFCQVNLRFVFLIMGLSTLLCEVLYLSMSSSLVVCLCVCVCISVCLCIFQYVYIHAIVVVASVRSAPLIGNYN